MAHSSLCTYTLHTVFSIFAFHILDCIVAFIIHNKIKLQDFDFSMELIGIFCE